MNWDELMSGKAKAEGWGLATIIDNGTTHPYLMVAREGQSPFKSDQDAGVFVVAQARTGSPLHRHALALIGSSRLPPTKETKKS